MLFLETEILAGTIEINLFISFSFTFLGDLSGLFRTSQAFLFYYIEFRDKKKSK